MSDTAPRLDRPASDPDASAPDPNDRVHHHARLDDDGRPPSEGGEIVTLCGLRLSGPRPDAATLPCCPMCNSAMGSLGRRCS